MSKDEKKRKLVGPWRNLHAAIWLIGLAILAWKGWWWPGILVLLALSAVLEAVLMKFVPQAFEGEEPSSLPVAESTPSEPTPSPVSLPPVETAPPAVEHRFELLPSICAKCGAPIRGHDVKWTGPQSADCLYCGANLEMKT
jgi:hypothetical protein